ncbi:protein of unknown function [uncultured Sphingopyxis sp.]|uniref:Antitoxin Xre/MbcA/ParS-like middle domain-containing protein n=1 Tax=uncultured Sphingopyxis sp. TaxID=310581 RepID=A0A1Y5PR59_9SPHN|nr:hypothetical protein [uncultured Sphingopyxis sp.]SBV31125.1 protein of unknown function [uncultured Sphingopyxis sp.]
MTPTQIKTREDARDAVISFFDTLSAPTLLKLAKALQRSRPDPDRLVRRMLEETGEAHEISGTGLGQLLTIAEGRARLETISVEVGDQPAETKLLGAGDMAERLGVARASLDNWRRARKVLAFRKGVRNYVYPVRQFDRHAPLEGLDRVRAYFSDDYTAWEWLVTPNRYTGDTEPIERLRKGMLDEVVRAAEGALDYQ